MFHQFHDHNIHNAAQGSVSKDNLYKLIKFVGRENILDAEEFTIRSREKKLTEKNLCLTFDDGLKSQYDIALPVLEDLKIKGFFFVYSSIFSEDKNLPEIYKYFRINCFEDMDEFCNNFFEKILNKNLIKIFEKNKIRINELKNLYPIYSLNDCKFRFLRDEFLTENEYKMTMHQMMKEKNFIPNEIYKILYIKEENLTQLFNLGHAIGLHSHYHANNMHLKSEKEQFDEYSYNQKKLASILKCDKSNIYSTSHPLGKYNEFTFNVLKSLQIKIGFRDSMTVDGWYKMKQINNSELEIAREDCATIIKMLNL